MNKNFYFVLVLACWFFGTVDTNKSISNITQIEETTDDHLLVEQWQDYVLANAIVANYLNILMVLASRLDFPLINDPNYCTTYIESPNSFRQTISQLADSIRRVLMNVYEDLNRVYIGLERIPIHLKTILLLIKKGNNDTINLYLPNLLKKSENIVNESFIILKNPITKIEPVKDLLIELDSLISNATSDNVIILQIEDVKTEWFLLSDLFTQLTIQTETAINNFLLQFNWLIGQFNQLGIDNYRDLIISLLQPKVIDIDRTTDLFSIITKTYLDISYEYTNIKMSTNTHLILLLTEQERKEIIRQHRYELQPEVVKIARSALQKHDEFLQNNQNRQIIYEKFLNEMSENDLDVLLSLN